MDIATAQSILEMFEKLMTAGIDVAVCEVPDGTTNMVKALAYIASWLNRPSTGVWNTN